MSEIDDLINSPIRTPAESVLFCKSCSAPVRAEGATGPYACCQQEWCSAKLVVIDVSRFRNLISPGVSIYVSD